MNTAHSCPSNDCRGQFFHLKEVGIVCSIKMSELAGDPPDMVRLIQICDRAREDKMEGFGLA